MDNYTLEELKMIFDKKSGLPKGMCVQYLLSLGHSEGEAEQLWTLLKRFPYFSENEKPLMNYIAEKVLEYAKRPNSHFRVYKGTGRESCKKQIYFERDGKASSVVFDLNDPREIIMYADFLRTGPDLIVSVDFIETITLYEPSRKVDVFDGDIFSTERTFFGSKSDDAIVVAHKDGYRKLLYTRGRGYIRDGKPDYDEIRFNYNVIALGKDASKIGNIYVDTSCLIEAEEGGKANDCK